VSAVSRGIDRIEVTFDEPNLVANAGLLLVATLVVRLGLERLINATVHLSGRVGGALPGRKVLTLVHAMAAGGSHIDHADILHSRATGSVLGHRMMAPSTLGTPCARSGPMSFGAWTFSSTSHRFDSLFEAQVLIEGWRNDYRLFRNDWGFATPLN
jgi:hypothetical protein